ncbi:hypothetical protein BDV40DRAFT_264471 [Aspergillus tamarii]|uniref:Ricin B lectin domain-containing protein n=1 Tax=Aspergillus tamarii TaxID=41984 RepID=A0A5N6UW46_ASPTM|nr:hypothetical protein BDV40DRAFT_264471 [Aspergillus tamarii]
MDTLTRSSEPSSVASDDGGFNTPTHDTVSHVSSDGYGVPQHDGNIPQYISPDAGLPSYSSVSESILGVCPWKGGTYIIRDPKTKLVIALEKGVLGLYPEANEVESLYHYGRGSHWHCVENDRMWLGFYNAVSGTYIGHDNRKNNWRFQAKAERHDEWEWFCARQHPDGGHILLVKHWNEFLPMRIGGKDGRELMVDAKREGGTVWEFIRVDSEK